MRQEESPDIQSPTARSVTRTADVRREAWNLLVGPDDPPFIRHEFLELLESSGCVGGDSGWTPCHMTIENQHGELSGVMPMYIKAHSYGEYVFDWAWARAYQQHAINYYPKLVCAVPFTPVTARKLLAMRSTDATALIEAAARLAEDNPVSSIHALFLTPAESAMFGNNGYLLRHDTQFHWHNEGYADFDHYLARFTSKRRKNIRAERRKVAAAGMTFRWLCGSQASETDWLTMHELYLGTISDHGGIPYLNRAFFLGLPDAMGERVLLLQGLLDGRVVCSALYFESDTALFGRYWGAAGFLDGLHFETCYYQPIARAIERGLAYFEAGAQGLHKLSRGLAPATTRSAHWLKHPGFYDAVDRYLAVERSEQAQHARLLNESLPFRRDPPAE